MASSTLVVITVAAAMFMPQPFVGVDLVMAEAAAVSSVPCQNNYDLGRVPKPWSDFVSCADEAEYCSDHPQTLQLHCALTCGTCSPSSSSSTVTTTRKTVNPTVTSTVTPAITSRNDGAGYGDEGKTVEDNGPTWQQQPWNYSWNRFPSLYFAAEPEGDMSDATLAKVAQFQLAIIEFRQSQFAGETSGTGKWADGQEGKAASRQCERLRHQHGEQGAPPCLVYRSGQWAGSMYASQASFLRDHQEALLPSQSKCRGFTDYPADILNEPPADLNLPYCRYDFRTAVARDFYADVIAEEISQDGAVQGLFVDNGYSSACDSDGEYSELTRGERARLQDDTTAAYVAAFSKIAAVNKYAILSSTNRFSDIKQPLVPWESDCPRPEESTVREMRAAGVPYARNFEFFMWDLGATCAAHIRNNMLEAENEVPTVVHTPYFPSRNGCGAERGCRNDSGNRVKFTKTTFLEFSMAAFLVGVGKGSYFGFSNMELPGDELGGWGDIAWDYFAQYDSVIT
eukprot:UC1_evm1s1165